MDNSPLKHPRLAGSFVAVLVALAVISSPAWADETVASTIDATAVDAAKLDKAVKRASDYLRRAQADDGSFSAQSGPGITAIVATALLRNGLPASEPMVARALAYLERHVQRDGGIYQAGSRYKNYETCLGMVAFHAANSDGKYDAIIGAAEKFVRKEQWDDPENLSYGGAGYGSHSRPDLSNTSYLIDALHTIGAETDDEALQKALIFVSRCQNLDSKYNQTEFASKIDDGGFYYTIAAGGSSQAGETPDGGLRSYGSMTYAGLKSMIYAGVSREDPRVKAAYDWIQKHYAVDENPGMGEQGLYYYYHTFAKALGTLGDDHVVDAAGKEHDWRAELVDELSAAQRPDGSWVNSNPRWLEGDPNLVTGYTLLALSYCRAE